MAAHSTSYPPRPASLCPPVHVPQGSEHLQGWRVLGAGRRLRFSPQPSPAPPPLLAGGTGEQQQRLIRQQVKAQPLHLPSDGLHPLPQLQYCEEPRSRACEPLLTSAGELRTKAGARAASLQGT